MGFDLFGGAAIGWPAAHDSLEALGLRTNPIEIGGGGRVTGLWKTVFVQVSVTRWADSGERAFVDSNGEVFPLGIPLDVKSFFIDGTIGVQHLGRTRVGRTRYVISIGGGAGLVRYEEKSPFAADGDDLATTTPSYHASVGVEVPLVSTLSLAGEAKYRHVPKLLGDGGASAALGDESLGGFQTLVGLRIAFGGRGGMSGAPTRPAAPSAPSQQASPTRLRRIDLVIASEAPVFLLPDATRTPLRTLPVGTSVRLLEDQGAWLKIEFSDSQYGPRTAYVERRFVRVPR